MILAEIQRDEAAASSAIATVMMFAGVLSIISLMLLSIVPVINELEGAIEASDAHAQLEDLAEHEAQLARRGLPGSTVEMEFNPVNGALDWRLSYGGVWFSAAWNTDQHLRLKDATDLDDAFDLRYPNGAINAYCMTDIHLQPESEWHYRLPDMSAQILFTLASRSTTALEDSRVTLVQGTTTSIIEIGSGETTAIDLPLLNESGEATLVSPVELVVMVDKGAGGASYISALDDDHLGRGTSWAIPLPIGTSTLTAVGDSDIVVSTELAGVTTESSALVSGDGAAWSSTFTTTSPSTLRVETSAVARLVVQTSDPSTPVGSLMLRGQDGSFLSSQYLMPRMSGTVIAYNPTTAPVLIDVQGASYSVPATDSFKLDWPQAGTVGTVELRAAEPLVMYWTTEESTAPGALPAGLDYVVAEDTGMRSGQSFKMDWSAASVASGDARLHAIPAGSSVAWTMIGAFNATANQTTTSTASVLQSSGEGSMQASTTAGHALRLLRSTGDDGALQVLENGQERCLPQVIQASGWIASDLPWDPVAEPTLPGLRAAWDEGSHPSGFQLRLLGPSSDDDFAALADAWATHVPELKYKFTSSITGLEVVNRGGIVATNHPEQKAHVLHSALSSRGEGSLLGIQLPVTMPTVDSIISGSAELTLELEVARRLVCSTETATDVRMGWYGPYGDSIVQWLAQDLAHSDDWIAFPEQLDKLDDYVGWVDRQGGEAVYHSPTQSIDLSLSMTAIKMTAMEAGG